MVNKKDGDNGDETKDLTTKDTYLPPIPDKGVLEQIKQHNLEGMIPNFEVITIPTGGRVAWEIPTETEEPEYEKEVIGTVLDHYPTRVYWQGEYEGGKSLPDCSSINGREGIINTDTEFNGPNPSGNCFECPYSKYDKVSGRVPCKEVRRVYVLTGKSMLPFLIPLPPTSGAAAKSPWTSYCTKLLGRGRDVLYVVTKFTLFKDQNKNKIEYSRVLPFMVRALTPEETTKVEQMRELFKTGMRQRPLTPEDEYNTNGIEKRSAVGGSEPWDEKKKDDIPF